MVWSKRASSERFADGVMLGQAVAISGATASPNMGYNTSPLVVFLLTMFNLRLGWWRSAQCAIHPVEIAERLFDVWTSTGSAENFLESHQDRG